MKSHVRLSQGTLLRSFLVLAICTAVFAVAASAQVTETANCSTPTAGQFSSVTSALTAALADPGYKPGAQIYINIYGPCQEYVKISGLQNVLLAGQSSATVLNQPTNPNGGPDYWPALDIQNSSWITVQNISFIGPGAISNQTSPLVRVQNSNAIGFSNGNFSGSVGDGIQVNAGQISINGPAMIQNNTANGINIMGASNVTVGGFDSGHPVNIQTNQENGIAMGNGGYLALYWYTTVTENGSAPNNTWAGLEMSGSTAMLCCGPGPNIDKNTGWGIDAEELSSVTVVGSNSTTPASISGNTQGGINDVASWIGIYNTTIIQNNGDHTQANPLGGIDVLSNGALQAYGAVIQNNNGPGLLVSQSSSADLGLGGSGNTTITGNTGSGIYVQVNGSVQFDGAGTTLTGNSPKDLTCAAAGIAAEDTGTPPTIGKMSCGNFFDLPPRKHKKAKN